MSITVHLKKHHFFYQELAKILDFRVTVRSDNDIYICRDMSILVNFKTEIDHFYIYRCRILGGLENRSKP